MPTEAHRLRSVLGNMEVARTFLASVGTGTFKSDQKALEEAREVLQKAAVILGEEARQVESGQTPTLRITDDAGKILHDGGLPYSRDGSGVS